MMESKPSILKGNSHTDERGTIIYNNDYDASAIKRIYFIENKNLTFIRGWQGHKVEQRWFSAVQGSFKIEVISIDDWDNPIIKNRETFVINSENLDVLHVPKGHITSIQSLEIKSKLMAMSDYNLGEIKDEYRFDINFFNNKD